MTYPKPTTKHKQYFLAGASGLVVSLLMFAMSTDHLNPDAVCNTDDGILTIDNFTLNDCESIILYLFYAMTLVSILGGFYIAYVVVHKHDVKRLRLAGYLIVVIMLAFISPVVNMVILSPITDSIITSYGLCHPDPPENEYGTEIDCLYIPSVTSSIVKLLPLLCAFTFNFFYAFIFKTICITIYDVYP